MIAGPLSFELEAAVAVPWVRDAYVVASPTGPERSVKVPPLLPSVRGAFLFSFR